MLTSLKTNQIDVFILIKLPDLRFNLKFLNLLKQSRAHDEIKPLRKGMTMNTDEVFKAIKAASAFKRSIGLIFYPTA